MALYAMCIVDRVKCGIHRLMFRTVRGGALDNSTVAEERESPGR